MDAAGFVAFLRDAASAQHDRERSIGSLRWQMDEPLLAALLPNTQRAFYVFDRVANTVVAGEEEVLKLFGYGVEEVRARQGSWFALVHPDDLAESRRLTDELAAGRAQCVTLQMRIARKGGGWDWVQHDWRSYARDESGLMLSVVGHLQLVTEMVMANQALHNEAALNSLCRMLVDEWVENTFLMDSTWNIIYVNAAAARNLGYPREQLQGRPLWEFAKGDSRRKGLRAPRMPRSQQRLVLRVHHMRRDGSLYPAEMTVRRLADDRLLALSRDVTQQQEQDQATRRQMAYYKGLFENNPSGVVVFDSTLRITGSNPALRRMLGYTDRILLRMNLEGLLATESRSIADQWRAAADDGAKQLGGMELVLRRRDGRPLNVHAALTMVPADGEASFQGIAIFTDISARVKAEEDLARQSEFNEIIVRESAAMIGIADKQGRLLKVNPAVERISGYTSDELVGRLAWESVLVESDDFGRARESIRELLEGVPRITAMCRIRTKSGESRDIEVHSTTTHDSEGQVERIIITALDVTEQQRLQQQLIQVVEQEQARIGHDLHDGVGQILTGIGTLTEALQHDLQGPTQADAAHIYRLVQQAIQQVRQLSHNMSPAAVQNRELGQSLLLLGETIRTNFRRNCSCSIDHKIKIADSVVAAHLFRIAQESVNNAIRHGNPSLITIVLRRDGAEHAVMEISNDGKSLEGRRKSSHGMGIQVMNYRANLIHADLRIHSAADRGVCVTCRFVLNKASKHSQLNPTKHKP